MAWTLSDILIPNFDGTLLDNLYVKAGLFITKTKTQRNTVLKTLYRQLDGSTTTLCFVSADGAIYELIANPATEGTTDQDWKKLDFGVSDILIAQGNWEADNTSPVLTDQAAAGNGNDFYIVSGAATPIQVQYPDLFQGQEVTVRDGDWVISNGSWWFISGSPINWDSLSGIPSVITDYVNGIVIAHPHEIIEINGLQAALDLKFDTDNVADSGIPFANVPNEKLADVLFLKTHYYQAVDLYTQTEIDNKIGTAVPLTQKGDMLTHNGVATTKKGVGATNQVPIADSTQPDGWKWGDLPIEGISDKQRVWSWSSGIPGGNDTYVDFIIASAISDNEIDSAITTLLFVGKALQIGNFSIESTVFANDTIRIVAAPSSRAGDIEVFATYKRKAAAIPTVGGTAAGTTYNNSDSNLAAVNVKSALDELDSKAAVDIVYNNANSTLIAVNIKSALDELDAKDASDIGYDNTGSNLFATDIEAALDELDAKTAAEIDYDNAGSTLVATKVETAIDELDLKTVALADPEVNIVVESTGSIKDTIDAITDNSSTKRYTILLAGGVYTEDNPIQGKQYVTIRSVGGVNTARIAAANASEHLFIGESLFYLIGISLYGVTGVDKYAVRMAVAGEMLLDQIVFTDCENCLELDHVNSLVNVQGCGIYTIAQSTTNGICVHAGNCTVDFLKIVGNTTVAKVIHADGPDSILTLLNLLSFSPNAGMGVEVLNGARVSGAVVRLVGGTDGLVISGNNSQLRLDATQIFNVQQDGLRVDNTGTGIEVALNGTTISGSTRYNANILNPNCIVSGNGFSELNKMNIHPDAKFYTYILDTALDDEGLSVFGEFHVGSPEAPAESTLGEGDSYTRGMLVYSWDGAAFADLSAAAASPEGSQFSPPNGNINTAIYMATTRERAGEALRHYGIKLKQDQAGGGFDYDVLVSGATTPTTAAGEYNDRGLDFNGNPVYIRTDNSYWLFYLQGKWCLNDSSPEATANRNAANYTSDLLEDTYTPVGANTGTPLVAFSSGLVKYWAFEYYDTILAAWVEFNVMFTFASPPYVPISDETLELSGKFQVRYDALLHESDWGKNDPMTLGTDYYWIRARIVTTLVVLPIWQQIKIHSNRTEINADGWIEYFGTARPSASLPWDLGLTEPANASPGDQDLYISDNLGVGRTENSLVNNAVDRIGLNTYLPSELDTSTGIYFRFSFMGSSAGAGNVRFVLYWGFTKDGSNVYPDTAGAPTTGPNENSIVYLHPMPVAASIQETIQLILDVSEMVSRRIGAEVGFGDTIWMALERTGNHVDDTYSGNISLINILPVYAKWCEGGHI